MITPLKDTSKKNNSAAAIKNLLPKGSVLNTYLFFSGNVELSVAQSDIFVKAHVSSESVYYFWRCLQYDGRRLHALVSSDLFTFEEQPLFNVLQENWFTYTNPFLRAGVFFLLNRCSDTGMISTGNIDSSRFNPISLSYLKKFAFPPNFYLLHEGSRVLDAIEQEEKDEYHFIPAGKFSYNLFEYGKNQAAELETINHKKLATLMQKKHRKIIATYDYHPAVFRAFEGMRHILINKYGLETTDRQHAEEVLVANF